MSYDKASSVEYGTKDTEKAEIDDKHDKNSIPTIFLCREQKKNREQK